MFGNRVFFGWWLLLGLFSSYMALVGVQVYTLPLFYPELIREFGWSTEGVTRAATIFFLAGAFTTPFVSSLYDRYSVRLFMICGATATILGLFAYSSLQTLTQMTIIYLVLALAQVCSGQVPTMLVVTRWFKRYRGIAIGIALTGTSLGGAVFPLVVRYVMERGSWRDAVFVLMIICVVMMVVPLIFLIRSRPEDEGLQPDGIQIESQKADMPVEQALATGPTLHQAVRTPAFYLLAFATGALWFCMNGIVQHQTIFMEMELGVSKETVPLIISAIFWFAITGKLLFGLLSDRFDKTLIMFLAVINLILGLSILRFSSAENPISLYGYAAVFGIGFSGTFTMIQLVIADFFSGQSYGKILGILTMVDVSSGGIGITVIARMQSAFNSYLPVINILIGLCCLVAVAVVLLCRMRPGSVQSTEPALFSNH
jgi:OFA family oxalate/formate antiporter-like MFS transporter